LLFKPDLVTLDSHIEALNPVQVGASFASS
jgi:hypothetical protein